MVQDDSTFLKNIAMQEVSFFIENNEMTAYFRRKYQRIFHLLQPDVSVLNNFIGKSVSWSGCHPVALTRPVTAPDKVKVTPSGLLAAVYMTSTEEVAALLKDNENYPLDEKRISALHYLWMFSDYDITPLSIMKNNQGAERVTSL